VRPARLADGNGRRGTRIDGAAAGPHRHRRAPAPHVAVAIERPVLRQTPPLPDGGEVDPRLWRGSGEGVTIHMSGEGPIPLTPSLSPPGRGRRTLRPVSQSR